MSGIYIHIPFCKTRCHYCDFFSSTNFKKIEDFVKSLKNELEIRKSYLEGKKIETIYFGGGTPSVLATNYISDVLKIIKSNYDISKAPEICVELNPDDITHKYLEDLASLSVNRLSIGVQSFFDDDLKIMNRRHNFLQAEESVKISQKVGFKNISIDLIYGLPKMKIEKWQKNLDKAFELNIQHLSAYHLTFENETEFGRLLKNKTFSEISENDSIQQFELLIKESEKSGFTHYEISNFAKPGYVSKHNSNYWKNISYLGVGPSAHSYNGNSRQWNVSNIDSYINSLLNKKLNFEKEELNIKDKYNEYIMTSLRTMWGCDTKYIEGNFGEELLNYFNNKLVKYLESNLIYKKGASLYYLTNSGKIISDSIIKELICV